MHPEKSTQQEWRAVLREAMDWLAEELHRTYEAEAASLLVDPWEARNRYGEVVTSGPEALSAFLRTQEAGGAVSHPEEAGVGPWNSRVRELLEMERNALRLFTSCGWFFDDLAGIETLQVLRYADRALELAGSKRAELEAELMGRLELARTNEEPPRTGRALFLEEVRTHIAPATRIAAGHAALRFLGGDPDNRVVGYVSRETDSPADGPGRTETRIQVVHGRTQREHRVRARVDRPRTGFLRVTVWDENQGDTPSILTPAQMPDGFRVSVEEILTEAVISRWLGEEDREALLLGRSTLSEVAGAALVTAVRGLSSDFGPDDEARVLDLTDLLRLLEEPVPFDAQTEFHRVFKTASPGQAPILARLAEPLGCVTTP
jgi:hypothetical protein